LFNAEQEMRRTVGGEGSNAALVDNTERRGRQGLRGRGPRHRREAEEYDAERPPPGRKSVEHCITRLPSLNGFARRLLPFIQSEFF